MKKQKAWRWGAFLVFLWVCSFSVCVQAQNEKSPQPDLLDVEDSSDSLWEEDSYIDIYDPLESMNRVFFTFNDRLYFWVLKPVKKGYSAVFPQSFRECLGNFFTNLSSPVRLVNTLLQGRIKDSGVVLGRFLINSTLGIYGIADVARGQFNIQPREADLGQTLGVYGVGAGIYLYLPFFGPTNARDFAGFGGDAMIHPVVYCFDMTWYEEISYYSVKQVNDLSIAPDVYENLLQVSLDPYVAARQAYYDYRSNKIKQAHESQGFL